LLTARLPACLAPSSMIELGRAPASSFRPRGASFFLLVPPRRRGPDYSSATCSAAACVARDLACRATRARLGTPAGSSSSASSDQHRAINRHQPPAAMPFLLLSGRTRDASVHDARSPFVYYVFVIDRRFSRDAAISSVRFQLGKRSSGCPDCRFALPRLTSERERERERERPTCVARARLSSRPPPPPAGRRCPSRLL